MQGEVVTTGGMLVSGFRRNDGGGREWANVRSLALVLAWVLLAVGVFGRMCWEGGIFWGRVKFQKLKLVYNVAPPIVSVPLPYNVLEAVF